jgi:hypothetical protein
MAPPANAPHNANQGQPRETEPARVRFTQHRDGSVCLVRVEGPVLWQVAERLEQGLHALGIQTLSSGTRRYDDRVVHWRRVSELDGSPVEGSRRLQLQDILFSMCDQVFAGAGDRRHADATQALARGLGQ